MRGWRQRTDWLAPGGGEAIVNVVDATGDDDIEWDVKGIRAERNTSPCRSRTYAPKRKRA